MEIEGSYSSLKEIAQVMQENFNKYWDEYCIVLAFAIILDSHFKLKFIRVFFFKKFDVDFENKSRSILDQLKKLLKEHEKGRFAISIAVSNGNQDACESMSVVFLFF